MFSVLYRKIKRVPEVGPIILENIKAVVSSQKDIKKLKNKHVGERCFIIGNGPSLRVEDLEKLKNEITFSTNRIYNIFDKTEWRSTYYCVQDYDLIISSEDEVLKMPEHSKSIMGRFLKVEYPKIKDYLFLSIKRKDFYPEYPPFSNDISKCIYEGMTVSYMCLQIAIYMGFKEVYLLGVDHSYSVALEPDGSVTQFEGVADHFSEKDKISNLPAPYKTNLAYEAAKKYADEHGVKIYNATRGGKLEVFERLDFDSLFVD